MGFPDPRGGLGGSGNSHPHRSHPAPELVPTLKACVVLTERLQGVAKAGNLLYSFYVFIFNVHYSFIY